jgi:FtsP/CotA-like multicopper oxidase with cupredoxin domain
MKQIKKVAIASVVCAGALATALPASAAVRNLYIAATDGYHYVPTHLGYPPEASGDGSVVGQPTIDTTAYRKVYMRGFCDDTPAQNATPGCANLPAPIIDVNLGDDVFITLRNIDNVNPISPKDPHTIHLHGQQVTTQNDGFNETSFEVPEGTQAVYYWYADKPGTFMWHCHVEASEHISMGMYGALIVRPKKANTVYGGQFGDAYDKEYVWMLSDVDSVSRDAIQSDFNPAALTGTPADPAVTGENPADIVNYNFADYQADYWLINGRAFPDTILGTYDPAVCNSDPAREVDQAIDVVGCNPAASGPPSGFLTGANNQASYAPLVAGNWGDRVLVRMINMGYQDQSFHFHGWHFNVVGKDANPIPIVAQHEQYTLQIGSGETHDVIINMVETANHENGGAGPNGVGNSLITGQGGGLNEFACVWGVYADASGSCNSPLGLGDGNVAVQWYPAHSHYDYQVTNNGGYPGGMAGLILATP